MYLVFEYQTSKEEPSYAIVWSTYFLTILRILVRYRISFFFFNSNFQMIELMNCQFLILFLCLVDQTAQEPVHVLYIRFVSRSPACILNFEQLQSAI